MQNPALQLLQRGGAGQSLINEQSRDDQDHDSRQSTEYFDNGSDPVHLDQNFHLVFVHLGFSVVEEYGIVFVHGESAAVDQKDNKDRRQDTPRDQQTEHRSHTPPRS
jgi:hypothetical protein